MITCRNKSSCIFMSLRGLIKISGTVQSVTYSTVHQGIIKSTSINFISTEQSKMKYDVIQHKAEFSERH